MKSILNISGLLLALTFNLSAQIDTSFYLPKYPTGEDGFVRDIEAFAKITQEEKDTLVDHEIEITLLILEDGTVDDAYVKGNVSQDLKNRVEAAALKLHHFTPAKRKGIYVQSSFVTSLTYNRYFPATYIVRNDSEMVERDLAWSLDIGGYFGGFSGEVSKVYGLGGGMTVGMGILYKDQLINLDLGIGGAQKDGNFVAAEKVIHKANNVFFNYGISYSRYFSINKNQSLRAKIGMGGYSVNVGLIAEDKVYSLSGLDLYSELSYAFTITDQITNTYFAIKKVKHYVIPFVQLHSWLGEEQSKGVFYNIGLRYSFESFGMDPK